MGAASVAFAFISVTGVAATATRANVVGTNPVQPQQGPCAVIIHDGEVGRALLSFRLGCDVTVALRATQEMTNFPAL
jgi:hypothetical protein